MKFTLNDYQADAVRDLLQELETAREMYHRDFEPIETSVALAAPTGAGKTVIAAATIEALFFGSDEFGFKPDPSAVVIWFSDNPSLNDQSLFRLMEASEKLTFDRLKTVKPPFAQREFDAGRVYFLNAQKLSRGTKLTRGWQASGDEFSDFNEMIQPDDQAYTIWQTIANTIENPEKTIYFVLDEAHRGFDTKTNKDRSTIVRRLVDGDESGAPIPIVIGISATIERFAVAMDAASQIRNRLALKNVTIEPLRVRESGLLKDIVLLDIPDEPGDFSSVLVGEAAKKLKASTLAWKRYALQEKLVEPVIPLMVLQVPNTPDHTQIGHALSTIQSVIPEIGPENVRNVLGENKSETFGDWSVDWIEPQRIQQTTSVRVLVAKEAISTGWDCPRAEVLVSFRPANDQTHIAQLLGRMVRSPLARRIPGNERLNSVDCILPYFDKTTAGKVVRYITGESEELSASSGPRLLQDGRDLVPNSAVSEEVWSVFDELATQSVPKRGVKPIKRLVSLAQALAADGIESEPLDVVKAAVHAALDEHVKANSESLQKAVKEIYDVHLQTLKGRAGENIEYLQRTVIADDRAILTGFDEAQRVFGADIATSYVNHIVDSGDGDDDDLREAYVRTSALATVASLHVEIDRLSDELASGWFIKHRESMLSLTDERIDEYDSIRSMAVEPQTTDMRRPKNKIEDFALIDADGKSSPAPLVKLHLLSDINGDYPVGALNSWEREVIDYELTKPSTAGWYRNPAHNGADSVTVAYRNSSGEWRSLHPDFIFFASDDDGSVRPSIIDPHGVHLEDWLVKLVGLAHFAERYGAKYERILAVVKQGNKWRSLDMQREDVRAVVTSYSGDAEALYKMDIADDYGV